MSGLTVATGASELWYTSVFTCLSQNASIQWPRLRSAIEVSHKRSGLNTQNLLSQRLNTWSRAWVMRRRAYDSAAATTILP